MPCVQGAQLWNPSRQSVMRCTEPDLEQKRNRDFPLHCFPSLQHYSLLNMTHSFWLKKEDTESTIAFTCFLDGLLLVICNCDIFCLVFLVLPPTLTRSSTGKPEVLKQQSEDNLVSVPFPLMPIFHEPHNLCIWNIFPIALAFLSYNAYNACQEIKLLWWKDQSHSWEHRNVDRAFEVLQSGQEQEMQCAKEADLPKAALLSLSSQSAGHTTFCRAAKL